MPSFCAVLNCRDRYGHSDVSFHKFPMKRKDVIDKWLAFARRESDWKPSKWSAICSQHFRDVDFNCVNERKTLKKTAVPSIMLPAAAEEEETVKQKNVEKKTLVDAIADVPTEQENVEQEVEQQAKTIEEHSSSNVPKTTCRLCGHLSPATVTFCNNFEIYGMIQKCFPTLNIQQQEDDNLPKDMCRICQKRLESFSRFIDKVLETQCELQRKFCTEKPSIKQLKIKQEPVVRVKQEVAENYDSFDDDENGEQEPETAGQNIDPKYEFVDFPMLNSQDIINNCDIMEIINLDDPFIDIEDDDANTCSNANNDSDNNDGRCLGGGMSIKERLPSAHELFQIHMLIEEHNYAKDDWNYYKTEKPDANENMRNMDVALPPLPMLPPPPLPPVPLPPPPPDQSALPSLLPPATSTSQTQSNSTYVSYVLDAIQKSQYTTTPEIMGGSDTRSSKPIVTSVSDITDSHAQFAGGDLNNKFSTSHKDIMAAASASATSTITSSNNNNTNNTATIPAKRNTKPNIVVLNESIAAFQLHACKLCQSKFFSVESLSQHSLMAHNQMPMVSVPNEHIMHGMENQQNQANIYHIDSQRLGQRSGDAATVATVAMDYVHNCKIEEGCENYYEQEAAKSEFYQALHNRQQQQQPHNAINILDMQQTFHRPQNMLMPPQHHMQQQQQHEETTQMHAEQHQQQQQHEFYYNEPENVTDIAAAAAATTTTTHTMRMKEKWTTTDGTDAMLQQNEYRLKPPKSSKRKRMNSSCGRKMREQQYKLPSTSSSKLLYLTSVNNYKNLQKRFRQLQNKYRLLQENIHLTQASNHHEATALKKHKCSKCALTFATIQQLLQHKKSCHHYFTQKAKHFSATCAGCEKFFRTKSSYQNHMRYICHTLSLRYFKMQTFKCRHCRSITFTHWRLYRRHEIKCKRKLQHRQTESQLNLQSLKVCLRMLTMNRNNKILPILNKAALSALLTTQLEEERSQTRNMKRSAVRCRNSSTQQRSKNGRFVRSNNKIS